MYIKIPYMVVFAFKNAQKRYEDFLHSVLITRRSQVQVLSPQPKKFRYPLGCRSFFVMDRYCDLRVPGAISPSAPGG